MSTSLILTIAMLTPFMVWAGCHYRKCTKKALSDSHQENAKDLGIRLRSL